MATLNGFAVKISWLGADHTYVRSSDGYVWPCWGRSSGGRRICSGQGSSAQANCLSQSDSHAGIIYGVTGVCHQTANRILWPARITVSRASGYWASVMLYGVYGTSTIPSLVEWEARKARCSRVTGDRAAAIPPSDLLIKATAKPVAPQSKEERAFLDKIDDLYAPHMKTMTVAALAEMKPEEFLARELDLIADFKLGMAKDPRQITTLQKLQGDALKEKDSLILALNNRKITGEDYAQRINDLLGELLKKCSQTVSKDQYVNLFESKPGVVFGIVDPKVMAKLHK